MLVIRLQRTGRRNLATYRLVVAERARAVKGKFLEIVGFYLPTGEKPEFHVEKERIALWLEKGAQPSNTVARLLKKEGMSGMEKFIQTYAKRISKKAPPKEADLPAPAPKADTAEPAGDKS